MIYLLTGTVRIKARAETDSGRFTKRYFYTVLSRVYNFYKDLVFSLFSVWIEPLSCRYLYLLWYLLLLGVLLSIPFSGVL
jgi:hypothetical protein